MGAMLSTSATIYYRRHAPNQALDVVYDLRFCSAMCVYFLGTFLSVVSAASASTFGVVVYTWLSNQY